MSEPTYRRSGLVPFVCEWCGADFMTERRKLKAGRGRLCSVKCGLNKARERSMARDWSGPNNPAWKGGISKDNYRYTLRFRQRHPKKYRAQVEVVSAIRAGRLVRPGVCSECGAICKPHGHHDDYALPLNVRWLCRPCHRIADVDRHERERTPLRRVG